MRDAYLVVREVQYPNIEIAALGRSETVYEEWKGAPCHTGIIGAGILCGCGPSIKEHQK